MKRTVLLKLEQFLFLLLFLIPCEVLAQGIVINGVVKGSDGEMMIGANVMEKGTNNGTITDLNGNFTLTVSDSNSTLIFSYIGFLSKEITVGLQRYLNVILSEDTKSLDEVVVIGYGTARLNDISGAIARADLSALENSPNVNILQTLKGVVPGLNIGVVRTAGGNPDISIRGRNSISGTQSPLIVLDGTIYRGAFTDINPNDVKSIDVLKDASSTAIYGSQGANGVILITTKTPSKISKPIIEYSGQLTCQRLLKELKPVDTDGFLRQIEDLFIDESRMGEDLSQKNPDFDHSLKLRGETIDGYNKTPRTNTNWWDLLSNPLPYIQTHNVSIRGRSESVSYFVSYGFTDQKNIVKNDKYNRNSIRMNLETKITDWLKIGTQSYYNISDFSGIDPGFGSLVNTPPLVSPYNDDGSIKTQIMGSTINPLLVIERPDEDVRTVLNGTFYGEITLPWIKGLSYRANYSRNWTSSKRFEFDPYGNSMTGYARKYHTDAIDMTFDNIVTYKNDFGRHSINATAVYGVEKRDYNNTDARANIFIDQSLIYNSLQEGQADQRDIRSEAWKETSLYTMGRIVYTYNNRYSFTGTARRDGFSGFSTNNKFGIFPSAAVAWRLSEEDFIKNNIRWIDNLKLRISHGQGGNRTSGRYATMAKMRSSGGYVFGDGGTGETAQNVDRMPNNNLKWETTTSTNIGLDFSILNGRLSGDYNFYLSNTRDLLYDINYPRVNGAQSVEIATNIGKLRNIGHEFSLNSIPIKGKKFTWDITLNFSLNKNKVISILGPGSDGKESDIIGSNIFIDKSLDPVYDFNIIGIWQISDKINGNIPSGFNYGYYKIEDIDGDGLYTAAKDRKILGYSLPLYRFSLINSVKYKDFDLRIMVNSIQGGKDHYLGRPARRLPIRDHMQNNPFMHFDYWTPENPNAKYAQIGEYNNITGREFSPLVSRSFIRLQELSLTYNLPSTVFNKSFMSRAKVFISGTNLLTITNWDGWDPEADQGLGHNFASFGDSYGGGPSMKSYSVGLNLEF